MAGYFYMGIRYLAVLSEIGFLYMWLRSFSEIRRLNRGIVSAVILVSAAAGYYAGCMENSAIAMIFELSCCFLISVLLFNEQCGRLFFYTISYYALGTSAECLFNLILNMTGIGLIVKAGEGAANASLYIPGGIMIILAEKVIQFAIYRFIIRILTAGGFPAKRLADAGARYSWKQYMMFWLIPTASCSFTAWIYTLGDSFNNGSIGAGIITVIAGMSFIAADSATVYLYEYLSAATIKAKELETENIRLEMEAKHYQNMDSLHEQYDVFIHDTKHVMRTIAALSEDGDCEKIGCMIDKMRINLGSIEQKIICGNKILNALLTERKGYAENSGIALKMEVKEPLYLQEIDDLDLITLMGNLLDNAIEAEKRSGIRTGILLCMRMAREGRHMIIQLENSYEENTNVGKVMIKRNEQIGNKHGIGLGSIRDIVRKYGGIIENEKREGRYIVKVILPVQSKWEDQKSYPDSAPAYLQLLSK